MPAEKIRNGPRTAAAPVPIAATKQPTAAAIATVFAVFRGAHVGLP
jgi:hypothetical protein